MVGDISYGVILIMRMLSFLAQRRGSMLMRTSCDNISILVMSMGIFIRSFDSLRMLMEVRVALLGVDISIIVIIMHMCSKAVMERMIVAVNFNDGFRGIGRMNVVTYGFIGTMLMSTHNLHAAAIVPMLMPIWSVAWSCS